MAFYIKNPETDRLARKLADIRGTGITEAVHAALEHELARERHKPSLAETVAEFSRRLRAKGTPEKGLPADKAFYDWLSGDE